MTEIKNESATKKIKLKRIQKNINKDTSGKNGKRKRIILKTIKILLFTFIAFGIIGFGIVLGVLNGIIDKTDSVGPEDLALLKLNTFLYDKNGKEIDVLFASENRVVVDYNKIPKNLINAVVSIEDERYWKHNGVDFKRTAAAIVIYITHGGSSSFGGSTITQQLVKTVTKDNETNWTRKIREWYRAIVLEKKLSKETILESYLNTIYIGEGANGVETAAQIYFGKNIGDLNLPESACLAAGIQSPEATNPYRGETNKAKLIARQKIVLAKMLELKYITEEEYNAALAYKLVFKKSAAQSDTTVQSYFVDAVIEAVVEDLMEAKNITRDVALKMIYSNGYKIYTTMDPKVQKAINKAYDNKNLFYKDSKGGFMQSALVTIDQKTGNVLGLMGGAAKKTGALQLNRATQSPRQTGSTFKPIGAYGPAFELGISYPGMGVDNAPFRLGSWRPQNYDYSFCGYMSVRNAIAQSMNIPAIKTCQAVGVDYAYQFAKNMGISTLVESDKNLAALAIGGQTRGATVIDMAAAYAAIANGGIYIKPKFYTKVLDSKGQEVLIAVTESKRVMKQTTAYLLISCLESVIDFGSGTYTHFTSKIDEAGKTGSTNNNYDHWFVGFTPYYTTACWNGYDQNRTIAYRKLGSYPYTCMRVYRAVAVDIHKGLAGAKFVKPAGIVKATVCTFSGLVATDACRAYGKGVVKTEIFAQGTVPTETCKVHVMADICPASGKIATDYCYLYNPLVSKSFITRDNPKARTGDRKYVLPTSKCTLHTSIPLDPYGEPIVIPTI